MVTVITTMATFETQVRAKAWDVLMALGYNGQSTALRGYYFLVRDANDLTVRVVQVTL